MDPPYYRNSPAVPGPGRGRPTPQQQPSPQQHQWGGLDDLEGPSRLNRPGRNYMHSNAPQVQQSQSHMQQSGPGRRIDSRMDNMDMGMNSPPPMGGRQRTEYASTSNPSGNIRPPPGMYPPGSIRNSSGIPAGSGNQGRSNTFRNPNPAPLIDPAGLTSPRSASPSGYGPALAQVKPQPNPSLGTSEVSEKPANDCEIIVLGKGQQQYAEAIENTIRESGLKVDLMFPKADVKLSAFIENIANMGTTFAVVIRSDNEAHRSVSVHILKGPPKPEEHRNMPLTSAYNLIKDRFHELKRKELSVVPESVKKGMTLILEDRFLTDREYQEVIQYVQGRWKKQREYEKRTDYDTGTGISTQEELRQRILKIVGVPAVAVEQPRPPQPKTSYENAQVLNYGHVPQAPQVGGYY